MKSNRMSSREARIDGRVTLYLEGGPRHFGMPGDSATVSMYVADEEQLGYVGETLTQCFAELWGAAPELTLGAYEPNARTSEGEVLFHVWHNGDPSVGIGGDAAQVTMGIADAEQLQYAREMLQAAFGAFWDARRVTVMTDEETREADYGEEPGDVYEPNAARRRKLHPGVKPWRVELSNAPNPDLQQRPGRERSGYWQGGIPARSRSVPVASFAEASQVVQDYIRDNELGGGNWTGGRITDYATGKEIGRVSYNGRVWPPGEWHMGQEALWPNGRKR